MEPDTRQLTSAIRAGDAAAFTRFYHEWFDPMLALARTFTRRDEAFCMDVVQEAMLRVIRSIPALETPEAFGAWVRRATLSAAYDLLRAERRRERRQRRAAKPEAAPRDEEDERLALLRAQIEALEPDAWELLRLRFDLGWTLSRIGERLGLKPGAVDGRLTRVQRRLKADLTSEGKEP